ncbi:ABC transporter ATP-binding protein [Rhizobium sp. SL42]|uniref:ABC transporter ATP-binding protein n=1 Tax=Rhizobium sp. SL42 TaxID=2806346 RepID=UPI001F1865CC|nr:ABC transporter ATP-binding protein [Rhizobium sp. SL42]UJW73792.1 ABC transporter ATP-binding protein [Rhizobium sp. SL42]
MIDSVEFNLQQGIAAHDLAAGYGRDNAIRGIRLGVEEGFMTALIGPNGSGKSTLLAALARILPARTGRVVIDGHDIGRLKPRQMARKLGMLPQQPPVPEGITVFDLVARGRFPHQGFLRHWSSEDESAVAKAIALTGIADLQQRPVETLSGGQRQRAWIAMVLAQETPLLLLDEPTTFLDISHQVAILDLLRDLVRHHGRTVICVLHDLNMALQYADRLIFLKEGSIRHVLAEPSDCTDEIVRDVFDLQAVAIRHPQTGLPVFLPFSPTVQREAT